MLGKRATKVGGVATGVEAAEITIQLPFGDSDASLIRNNQRSIHGDPRSARAGFRFYPAYDFTY